MQIVKPKQAQNQGRVLSNLQKWQNELWNDFWGFGWPSTSGEVDVTTTNFLPEVDLTETKKAFKVKVNLPGVDPEKINVEVDGNALVLSGETKKETKEEGEIFHRVEPMSGSFHRSLDLPNIADLESISCKARHGLLTISIPKKSESEGQKIKVEMD